MIQDQGEFELVPETTQLRTSCTPELLIHNITIQLT